MNLRTNQTSSSPARNLFTAPFVAAVTILGVAAILAGPVSSYLKVRLVKDAVPLRKPLAALDEAALYPYRVVKRVRLEPSMIEELGTEEYVYWILEDAGVDASSPLREATLFVTYYTGGADLVPHTPDACYLGFGYQPAQAHENRVMALPGRASGVVELPVRVLTFMKTALHGGEQVSVVYTFRCNGEYVSTREGVRRRVNSPLISHAYFSKVEISFPRATREQHLTGGIRLLQRALDVLERDHWPQPGELEDADTAGGGQAAEPAGRNEESRQG